MAKQLDGLRILDLTNVLAGPFCAYQMALLGAEVIKVEKPGTGDLARQLGADVELNRRYMGASFLAQNSGKMSMTLNLKSSAGKEIFLKLVETADALIENFRPGVMERLGLGYEELKKVKPDLVYCAISGYGKDGPLSNNPAYDQIIQGMSGVMSITGNQDSAPLRVGCPVADTMGGITAAFATTAALLSRERTGKGDFIDVSMLESTIVAMGWAVSNWLIGGVEAKPIGNENMTASPSGTFVTGEGLLNIAANRQVQFVKLCEALQRPDLIIDPRFENREVRKKYRNELKQELEYVLKNNKASYWADLLNDNDVPAGEVLNIPEVLDHPQTIGRGFIQKFNDVSGIGRDISVVRSGFKISSGDPAPSTPPPVLGQDTDNILTSLGYCPIDIESLKQQEVV